MKISLNMITMDRTPKENYIKDTIMSLKKGGVFDSNILGAFNILVSNQNSDFLNFIELDSVNIVIPEEAKNGNENYASAVLQGYKDNCDYIMLIEDDISVCAKFLESTVKWLEERFVNTDYSLAAIYSPYEQCNICLKGNINYWDYPIPAFYGTQCVVIRPEDAVNLYEYLLDTDSKLTGAYKGKGWDLIMAKFYKKKYPDRANFITCCPSFVQHTGDDSVIDTLNFHKSPSFKGENWSYV